MAIPLCREGWQSSKSEEKSDVSAGGLMPNGREQKADKIITSANALVIRISD